MKKKKKKIGNGNCEIFILEKKIVIANIRQWRKMLQLYCNLELIMGNSLHKS